MQSWATGVAVVTSRCAESEHGMTVNSFISVSLEPPTILISLARNSRTCVMALQSGIFGITVLASNQQNISERFAGRTTNGGDRFDGIATQRLTSGVPFIVGGLAFLDCQVTNTYEIATHVLFLGQVVGIQLSSVTSPEPLLYFNRAYQQIAF